MLLVSQILVIIHIITVEYYLYSYINKYSKYKNNENKKITRNFSSIKILIKLIIYTTYITNT